MGRHKNLLILCLLAVFVISICCLFSCSPTEAVNLNESYQADTENIDEPATVALEEAATSEKSENMTTEAESTTEQTATAEETADTQPQDVGCIGNKNSKIYHYSNCDSVKKMKDKNKVYFDSFEEAKAAGYKACKNCNPPQ